MYIDDVLNPEPYSLCTAFVPPATDFEEEGAWAGEEESVGGGVSVPVLTDGGADHQEASAL
jgi:hypothetical protein